MTNLVDIIIPNYNKEKYLVECIDSVVNQIFPDWKIYLIDDCSNDRSLDLLKKYDHLNKIKIVSLNKNKGPAFCRNFGMRISNAKYISFLDSDDFWEKDKLSKQIEFMEKNKFKFTFTDFQPFFQKNNIKKYVAPTNLSKEFDFKKFINNSSINSSTMIIERSIVKFLKFKKLDLMEDYVFKCQILRSGSNAYKLGESLASYRILIKSRSGNKLKNLIFLWSLNKKYNNLNFFQNLYSVFMISLNSLKKYGFK